MSLNSQSPPNQYVSRNIGIPYAYNGQIWFDNMEDPYLGDFYATTMNYDTGYDYYYYQPISGYYVDDHACVAADHDQFSFMASTNFQSHHTYNGQSWFDYIDDPHGGFNQPAGELIDGVYVVDGIESIDQHQALGNYHCFAPHNSPLTDPGYTYTGQIWFDHIEDPDLRDGVYNQPTDYHTPGSGFIDDANDRAYLIELRQLSEATEETIITNIMRTRTHCSTDDGGETCSICLCEYESDETIGTLECQHEYHASCIKQWLLKGKTSCPLCRSSVLPS
ncbi:putative deoxyuridine 5'-triphosphate nucleotidohydrolase-like [Capsicum annuum]|nr:putative deoxyuridine 5'-triphosphate nucleotidohydrolase-like [Capsicum annuum]